MNSYIRLLNLHHASFRIFGTKISTLICSLIAVGAMMMPLDAHSAAQTTDHIDESVFGRAALISRTALNSMIATSPQWISPTTSPFQVVRGYSLPHGPYGAGHRGIDLAAATGQTVKAPTHGTVSFVGVVVDRPVLSIRLDAHTVVSFEPVTSDLTIGAVVEQGQLVGEVQAGHCASGCVHLGVRIDNAYTNPLRFLRLKPELLPWS